MNTDIVSLAKHIGDALTGPPPRSYAAHEDAGAWLALD